MNSDKVDSLIQSAVNDLELVRLPVMNKKTEQIKEMNENKFEEFVDKINGKQTNLKIESTKSTPLDRMQLNRQAHKGLTFPPLSWQTS